jgi:hypothetical protein
MLLLLYQVPTLALPIYFLVMPAALVIILYLVSGRWDGVVAPLIVLTNIIVTLLVSIPDLFLQRSLSIIVFQSLKALLSSGALASLTGLWLARATTGEDTQSVTIK